MSSGRSGTGVSPFGSNRSGDSGSSGKFQNKNMSSSFKAPQGTLLRVYLCAAHFNKDYFFEGSTTRSPAGMTVVRGNKGITRAVGAAAAPVPLNTPSVRRENNGRDPSVNIVPGRSAGIWGQSSEEGSPDTRTNMPNNTAHAPVATSAVSKPAPWAKPTAPQSTVEPSVVEPTGSSKLPPALKPHTTNWADVDVDSDEEEDAPPSSRAPAASAAQPAGQQASQPPNQPARGAEPSLNLSSPYNHGLSGPNDSFRKDRSGSGSFGDSFGDQRRFGSFGGGGYGHQGPEESRFAHARGGPFGSGDARFGGPSQGGDMSVRLCICLVCFVHVHLVNMVFFCFVFLAQRSQFGYNGFGGGGPPSRGGPSAGPGVNGSGLGGGRSNGPDRSFGHNPAFAPAQRPPVGDFAPRGTGGGGGGGGHSSFGQNASIFGQSGYYGSGSQQGGLPAPLHSDPHASAELRAIEATRYEAELLEARKQRKRTMSSEGLPPSSEATQGSLQQQQQHHHQGSYASQHGQGQDRDFGGINHNFALQDARSTNGGADPRDRRDGGVSLASRSREDPFGGMGGHPASGPGGPSGAGGPGGYGLGGPNNEPLRIPHRTRGPAVDQPSEYNGIGGQRAPYGGSGGYGGYDAAGPSSSHSAEPMWERAKRPMGEPSGMPNRLVILPQQGPIFSQPHQYFFLRLCPGNKARRASLRLTRSCHRITTTLE